jgi:hypothetical protein
MAKGNLEKKRLTSRKRKHGEISNLKNGGKTRR